MGKDQAIDRLLRRASHARANTDRSDGCLSAELLAAWTDGALTDSERGAAEAHAADCSRCLAVLSAIADTSPAPQASPRASWFSIKWLIPAATAGVAVIAWILVQPPAPPPPAVPAPQQEAARPQAAPSQAGAQPDREADGTARSQAANRSTFADRAEKNETAAAKAPLARQREDATAQDKRAPAPAPAPAQTPAPARAPAPPAAPVAAPPATAGVAAASPAVVTEAQAKATRDERKLAEQVQLRAAAVVVVAPDPNVRWRISGTAIERSTDGGRNWQGQTAEGTGGILAGAAPSATVCWLVGRAGLVLLTSDGQTWRRIEFPVASADLVAVTAQDAQSATVTAADGRNYRTVDAGRTWTLQENPTHPF